MVRYLSPYADIVVSSRSVIEEPEQYGCKFVDVKVALAQPLVIPSMPSQFLEGFFKEHAKDLKPGSLVVDICSVKVKPVKILLNTLPDDCELLATHPLFGPGSAASKLEGHRIMLHQTRISDTKYLKIKSFLTDTLGLKIIECTPDEHDKNMAYVLGLTQYLGRIMQGMQIPDTGLKTDAYCDLLDMKRIQGGDSHDLLKSIILDNPYTPKTLQKFRDVAERLDDSLGL